jgi:hypothetical protein
VQRKLSREYLGEAILNSSRSAIPEIDQTTSGKEAPKKKSALFAEKSSTCLIHEDDYIARANAMWSTSVLKKPAITCQA